MSAQLYVEGPSQVISGEYQYRFKQELLPRFGSICKFGEIQYVSFVTFKELFYSLQIQWLALYGY